MKIDLGSKKFLMELAKAARQETTGIAFERWKDDCLELATAVVRLSQSVGDSDSDELEPEIDLTDRTFLTELELAGRRGYESGFSSLDAQYRTIAKIAVHLHEYLCGAREKLNDCHIFTDRGTVRMDFAVSSKEFVCHSQKRLKDLVALLVSEGKKIWPELSL
jgi:hypothetical protein